MNSDGFEIVALDHAVRIIPSNNESLNDLASFIENHTPNVEKYHLGEIVRYRSMDLDMQEYAEEFRAALQFEGFDDISVQVAQSMKEVWG